MTSALGENGCIHSELVHLYALRALPQVDLSAMEAHLEGCADCRRELDVLRTTVDAFVDWPTDVLRPPSPLWDRIAGRVAEETGGDPLPAPSPPATEPEWKEVAPGISCKLLSTDKERRVVSMLVRLAPKTDYPPHRHAGLEELWLLEGVLIVDDKTLYPGDYLRSEAGTADARVYSETGCTCVLITSIDDKLR